jgi:hypothetical protein
MVTVSGFTEMSGALLLDRRRNVSAARLFDRLVIDHEGSFSRCVGNAGRQAGQRLFAAEQIKPADMLSGHVAACGERFRLLKAPDDYLLILQDTTDFDYSGHKKTTGLGSIGQGLSLGTGLQSHGALAVSPSGLPLGVVHLDLWARHCEPQGLTKAQKHQINQSKPIQEKESLKWLTCLRHVQTLFPPEVKLLFVQDREADMFELFEEPRRAGMQLLVRATQPRGVQIISLDPAQANTPSTVFVAVRSAAVLGQVAVKVSAKRGQSARNAVLDVRVCPVLLQAPTHRKADQNRTAQPVWLISAREVAPPAGEKPVDWTLITTIATASCEEACQILTYYQRRWLIERLHYVLKSGLHAENLRFDDAASLANGLALYYIVAWRLLHLTYLARLAPDQAASHSLEPLEIQILCQIEAKPIVTISEAVLAIAKIGGYRGYPSAAPPGAKTIWLGLRKLEGIVTGYLLAMAHLKDVIH